MSGADKLIDAQTKLQSSLLECASAVGAAFAEAIRQEGVIIHKAMMAYHRASQAAAWEAAADALMKRPVHPDHATAIIEAAEFLRRAAPEGKA